MLNNNRSENVRGNVSEIMPMELWVGFLHELGKQANKRSIECIQKVGQFRFLKQRICKSKILRYNNGDGNWHDMGEIVLVDKKIQGTEWYISELIIYVQFEVIQKSKSRRSTMSQIPKVLISEPEPIRSLNMK